MLNNQSFQPLLHGSLDDRQTDRPRYSVGSNTWSAQWRSQILLLFMDTEVFIGTVDSNTPCLPFLRKRSPNGATFNPGSRHPIATHYLSIDPKRQKAELAWLVDQNSGRFTHISGHPSATGLARDTKSSPAKDDVLPPCHETNCDVV